MEATRSPTFHSPDDNLPRSGRDPGPCDNQILLSLWFPTPHASLIIVVEGFPCWMYVNEITVHVHFCVWFLPLSCGCCVSWGSIPLYFCAILCPINMLQMVIHCPVDGWHLGCSLFGAIVNKAVMDHSHICIFWCIKAGPGMRLLVIRLVFV